MVNIATNSILARRLGKSKRLDLRKRVVARDAQREDQREEQKEEGRA